jgi:hypothetical protein
MSSVLATRDFAGSNTSIIPDQSGLKSVDLQFGQTFPIVTVLHLRQAFSFAKFYLPPAVFFSFVAAGAVC